MGMTTIQLKPATRKKLARLKGKDTYDALINKLLALIPEGDDEGRYTDEFRHGLLAARLETLQGKTLSQAVVRRRLGL
jgi:hypothetical protein